VRLRPFDLIEPGSVAEAVAWLARTGDAARIVSGGTALVPMIRLGLLRPDPLITLHRVAGLADVSVDDGTLFLGAMVSMAELVRSSIVRGRWTLLAEAAGRVASPAIRSTATVGGNLAYAEAASDVAPALLCLEASVETVGPSGDRSVPITSFFTGFYETALQQGAIVKGVRVPACPESAAAGYVKFCPRSAEDKPLIGVAALVDVDRGRCRDVRIALGGAAPTPIRASRAEAVLRGETLSDSTIRAAAEAAAEEADPLSDLMGSAQYRREMVRVWTRRLLTALRNGRRVTP
jgi:aerobic carbon-monoxide dehydrogenase medium subunit